MAPKTDHMEYSKWHEIVTTWSTPWGSRNKSSGALCIFSTVDIVFNVMTRSIWSYIFAIWSTPYGIKKQPYGVLHVAVDMDLCGGSLSTPYGTKNQPYGVLHMA